MMIARELLPYEVKSCNSRDFGDPRDDNNDYNYDYSGGGVVTLNLLMNWSTSELNTQLNPMTCLGDTGCWIQQVTAPTMAVTCWIQQVTAPTMAVTFGSSKLHAFYILVGQGGLRPSV